MGGLELDIGFHTGGVRGMFLKNGMFLGVEMLALGFIKQNHLDTKQGESHRLGRLW